jgi:FtsH-binding integral membrane protein
MKASTLCFRASVLFVIAGMIWGLVMAISENHVTFPAHAHLNLLGWVSLFLFGIFYHLHPEIDRSRAALVQVWIWMAGVVIQVFGVGRIYTGHPSGEAFAATGSFIVLGAMILFAWLVYRRERYAAAQGLAASPAR